MDQIAEEAGQVRSLLPQNGVAVAGELDVQCPAQVHADQVLRGDAAEAHTVAEPRALELPRG